MAGARKTPKDKKPIEQYEHADKKRKNNPPVGLVTPQTDRDSGKNTYAYDPHLDPQLVWAGKAEHTSFDVPTVSLHVHERIDPRSIVEAVRKRNGAGLPVQGSLFEQPSENPPLRDAIDFYKHDHEWSNRLIAGDSLLVMNSLLEKEGMAGQVQMVYIDPPYGIRYGSNFQPFVNKRDVKDGKDEDLTQEPEMIRAFRDTWELGIHSYLTYLRDRLLLARELLHESGSCFVQISDENLHLVRNLMDEIFDVGNSVAVICFVKATAQTTQLLSSSSDYVVWYAKEKTKTKYHQVYLGKELGRSGASNYTCAESPDTKHWRRLTRDELERPELIPAGWRIFSMGDLTSQRPPGSFPFEFGGQTFTPGKTYWKTSEQGLRKLGDAKRLIVSNGRIYYKRYIEDFPCYPLTTTWTDSASSFAERVYVVQTTIKVVQRCVLMTTDPGDLVFDPTCGSATTSLVAEQWGRRWITCDTSRVATTLAKQRLMTTLFDYYELAHPDQGVGSGFRYKTVPHVTLKSIANNEAPTPETLYDQPFVENKRARVSGPFTVEAVPAPAVKSLSDIDAEPAAADASVSRSGATLRHAEWRDELLKCGVRGKNRQHILFSRVEPLAGTRWLHAEAETKPNDLGANSVRDPEQQFGKPERVVFSFGPEHAPLEQRQVELAWEEARQLSPRPAMILFVAFQFDPEAAKDIDELTPEKTGMIFLKVQMNTDLLTDDLKKKRASNESFWLVGQPDVELRRIAKVEGEKDAGDKYQVEVHGFDYYNTKTGAIESGGTNRIAVWMLDTDYDGRSLFPRQVFFPMAGDGEGWARLAKNLKAEIDEGLIEAYRGTVSLPFEAGDRKRVAVKIVDDRGIESLKIVEVGP
ncbi:MAG: site-specific DNA-methyltransferase [Acidobacteriota bacterium]